MTAERPNADTAVLPPGLGRINQALLQSVGVGIAIVDPASLAILFLNERMSEYVPEARPGASLGDLIGLPRLGDIGPGELFQGEAAVKVRRRSVTLAVTASHHFHDGRSYVLVECQNISRIRELEAMIGSYSAMVEKNQRELRREKERAEKLLLNIMPRSVYEEMKAFGVTAPRLYQDASVIMLDFIDFTEMSIASDPTAIVAELNDIFTAFDRIVEQFGCERIKTMGDAYVAVAGVPDPTPDHRFEIARVALGFRRYIGERNATRSQQWRCRIGVACGPLIGSIVGVHKYVYDILGPAVNLAARLEAACEPMEICITDELADQLRTHFRVEAKETMELKGFGRVPVSRLVGSIDPATGRGS
jgi:class 3 adenylate cyclase